MRTSLSRSFLVVCSLAALLCGAASAASDSASLPAQVLSAKGAFRLTLQSLPSPLPVNELFEIRVSVDASAAPDESSNPVWLRADAEMPAHRHGMNTRVIVEQLGDGQFLLKGLLFHMRGEWLITFDLAKGRVHEQAQVRVVL